MKILIVTAQFPFPPRSGFATRVYQLAKQLSLRHEVTLLSYAHAHEYGGVGELAEQMAVRTVPRGERPASRKRVLQALTLTSRRPYYCRDVESREMQSAIDRLCAETRFDIIQVETSLLCGHRFPGGPRLVIDEHNIESEVFLRMREGERSTARRAFNRIEHLRCRRFESAAWMRADACVVTSERELPSVRVRAPGTPVVAVPNSVDLAYFTPCERPPRPRTVVFNGILTYRPNVDAVRYLIDEVWPLVRARRPDAALTLVGRCGEVDRRTLQAPGVEILGEVPDIRPHIQGAAVVAVPVRIGGGTRLKVVEGLAMGKAIVSTSLGCEGLAVRDREHLLIADDPAAFAARVLELFEDPPLSGRLGAAGRRLVEERYSWDHAGGRLESLYRQLTKGHAGRSIETEFETVGG